MIEHMINVKLKTDVEFRCWSSDVGVSALLKGGWDWRNGSQMLELEFNG